MNSKLFYLKKFVLKSGRVAMWCSESNWLALGNGSWASGCYYHTVQISSGATVLAVFPIIYFVLIQYYAGLATVQTDRHLLQYCRVLLSILLGTAFEKFHS